jgi:outer membrane lipoprotein-sorting protein
MNRLVAAASVAALSILVSAAGLPAPGTQFTGPQRQLLDRVSAYLNSIKTLKGGFIQMDPNGAVEQGAIYLSKPGRMRFEYQPPSPTLVVSDGATIAVKNSQLNTVDRYPLTDTPLDLILSNDLDLSHNRSITGVSEEGGELTVHARSDNARSQGNISIVFSEPQLELRQWTIVDAQGSQTTVALRDVQTGVALPGSLFVLPDKKSPFTRKGEE